MITVYAVKLCRTAVPYIILIKLNLLFCSCLFWVIIFILQVCNTITVKTTEMWLGNCVETLNNVVLNNEVETLQVHLPIIKYQTNLFTYYEQKLLE